MAMFDVTIIGAGVIGCNAARELSKYKLNICVVEKGADVAEGTTKANSAIVHAGFDAKPGTMKGKLNAKGNAMFDKLSKELDFPFNRNGSMVLCFDENSVEKLEDLKKQGELNGVPGIEILDKEQIRKFEPNLSENVVAALYVPTGGIVCPYEMTIALAENALMNGTEFKFNTEVKNIEKNNGYFTIKTNNEDIETRLIINAAGLFSDSINNMVSANKIHITPRKGEYCLFDKAVGDTVKRTIFQLPTKMGKGILVTPTIDGNLLIGPNALDIDDKSDVATTQSGMDEILSKAKLSLKEIPMRYIITSFSGLRAHSDADDFIIGEAEDVENFINAAAIESPGLSSAPSIAEMLKEIVVEKLSPDKKKDFNPIRIGIPKFREMNNEERQELIEKNSAYGKMVCRCETVTEGEIIEAIRRPLGARTLDGLKRRTRAGMGRCQAGFCTPKLVSILARELNIPEEEVTKFGRESKVLIGKIKEV
jgi:glycerol-3-phosphate dehydrogenase